MGLGGWTAERRDTSRHVAARAPAATAPGPCGAEPRSPAPRRACQDPPVTRRPPASSQGGGVTISVCRRRLAGSWPGPQVRCVCDSRRPARAPVGAGDPPGKGRPGDRQRGVRTSPAPSRLPLCRPPAPRAPGHGGDAPQGPWWRSSKPWGWGRGCGFFSALFKNLRPGPAVPHRRGAGVLHGRWI